MFGHENRHIIYKIKKQMVQQQGVLGFFFEKKQLWKTD